MRSFIGIATVATILVAVPTPVVAQAVSIDTGASALEIAQAIAADPSTVTGGEFVELPPSGSPNARAEGFLSGFPRDGATFGILTSGDARLADDDNTSESSGTDNDGANVRGDTDFDVTVLRIDVDVPSGVNCLVGVEFRFLSDEYPEFVGTSFNDAFIIELDASTWTTSGSVITAPDNFAFDPAGNPISINAAGVTSMTAGEAAGTTYDGATPVLSAATPITPGSHSIYVSIFDQGDQVYDSAVFIDDLRFGTVANVATDCIPGAQPVDEFVPLPLVAAHGITGVPQDMNPNLLFAEDVVDGLPGTLSADTGEISSVFVNGGIIVVDSFDLATIHDSGAVNLIAHSKGGLDSRAAMWLVPSIFEDLAMLATPNGGSGLANNLCRLRRLGWDSLMADFGPCDSSADGLYNLQTGWIKDTYNAIVRDSPQHDFWIAAGDCMGFVLSEGAVSCNATSLVGHNCTDVDGFLGLGDDDGENAVCVWSAFAQVNGFDPGGLHYAIDPVFEGLNHTDMRQDPCPNTAVLAWMYGPFYPDNPWITGDGSDCEDLPRLDETFSGLSLQPVPAAEVGTIADAEVQLVQPQAHALVTLDATGHGTTVVDDEGAGLGVVIIAAAGDVSGVELATDQVIAPELASDIEVFEQNGSSAYLYPAFDGPATLSITGAPGASIGVMTSVVSDVEIAVDATALNATDVDVTVTMTGASPSTANDHTVVAIVGNTGATTQHTLSLRSTSGSTLVYGTTIQLPRGEYQPIDVVVTGPHSRTASTGIILPDGSGSIDALVSDTLVDTDGNDTLDALELQVGVTVADAGEHLLSLQLETDGAVVGTGGAIATLDAGAGIVTVTIGLDEMASMGLAGPYEITDLVLTAGLGDRFVATRDSLGFTGAISLADLGDGLTLSRPTGVGVDTDDNGSLDTLRWSVIAWAPVAGTYDFDGTLFGPQGAQLALLDESIELVEGPNTLTFDFDGALVGEHRDGRYVLVDLTAQLSDDAAVFDRAPAGFTDVLTTAAWIGGEPDAATLILLWRQADADGDIFTLGLFRSELNRLQRIQAAIDDGNLDTAVAELVRFIDHVEERAGRAIDPLAAQAIAGFATSLLEHLLE